MERGEGHRENRFEGMSRPSGLGFHDKLAQGAVAARALEQDSRGIAGLEGLRIARVLKFHPARAVFLARLGPDQLILKRITTADARAQITAMQDEMALMAPRMAQGALRVPRCLGAWPELGLIGIERAPGKVLTDALATAGPGRRRKLIAQAANWLDAYTDTRRAPEAFRPEWWLRQIETAPLAGIGAADAALLRQIGDRLAQTGDALRDRPAMQGAAHGDFVPANLHHHQGTIWGIDITGARALPLAKELARFLVWARLYGPTPPATRLGLDAAEIDAMLRPGLLAAGETETTLPFFIGYELFMRFLNVAARARHLPPMREALAGWLTG